MIRRLCFSCLWALLATSWSAAVRADAVLSSAPVAPPVQVDIGDSTAPLQLGWFDYSNPSTTTPQTRTITSAHGVGGSFDASFSGQTHYLDYSPITGPHVGLSNLLEDYISRAGSSPGADGTITLQLDTLEAGDYQFTSYHHSNVAVDPAIFDIAVTDADRTNETIFSDLAVLVSATPATLVNPSFQFRSDGLTPVEIFFDRTGQATTGNSHFALNGFELAFLPPPPLAPEPSTFILFGIVLTLLAGYYYRRRRLTRVAA